MPVFSPDSCVVLNVSWCARQGLLDRGRLATLRWTAPDGRPASLAWTCIGPQLVWLTYQYVRSDQPLPKRCHYRIVLERTRTSFGGWRSWFTCPHCAGRAAKLYLPHGASHFLCRVCHGLTYATQHVRDPLWRLRQRIDRLKAQLDAPRRATRTRLRTLAQLDAAIDRYRAASDRRLAALERRTLATPRPS